MNSCMKLCIFKRCVRYNNLHGNWHILTLVMLQEENRKRLYTNVWNVLPSAWMICWQQDKQTDGVHRGTGLVAFKKVPVSCYRTAEDIQRYWTQWVEMQFNYMMLMFFFTWNLVQLLEFKLFMTVWVAIKAERFSSLFQHRTQLVFHAEPGLCKAIDLERH